MKCVEVYKELYHQEPFDVAFCPYRISPLGAHIDHQYGKINGLAIDKGIHMAYHPKQNGVVELQSLNFPKRAQFFVNAVPEEKQGDWADHLRGAAKMLGEKYRLKVGLSGIIEGSLPIGGLSSSASVIICFLSALCKVNGIHLEPMEMILTAKAAENQYVGVACGKLDQSCEVLSKKNHLLYLDTKDDSYELIPTSEKMKPYKVAIFFSSLERSLKNSKYNLRQDECKAAAYALMGYAGMDYDTFANTRLRDVPYEVFEAYKDRLPELWRRRAEHYYSEFARAEKGAELWRKGDLEGYGQLVFESGKYTRNVYYIGNLEFAKLVPGEAHFYDLNGDEIEKQTTEIKWDAEAAEKGGFEHFMMKEIHEQPKAVQDTLNSVIKDGAIDLSSVEITEEEIKNFEQIYIIACGSAWHVGMAAQYVLESMADVPVRVELASEFRYRKMPLDQKALVIVVSQSGETADTLAALRLAKEKGITTMAIVNVVGSSIAREADKVFYTLAGPEISVATTKAYSAQLAAMYCLAVQFAKVKGKITDEQYSYYISELLTLPEKMQKALEDKERIQWFAAKYANAHDVFFVGRGVDYAVCLEGSLKLKEISYIHSEAYAAGELKHGTISLIEQGTLVIGVLTQSELYEKTISNMLECKSRGAYLMGLTTYGKYEIEDQVNFTVYVPKVDEHFIGSLAVIPLQLLGYYVSVAKGLDVDKPRNLAKSVTVE